MKRKYRSLLVSFDILSLSVITLLISIFLTNFTIEPLANTFGESIGISTVFSIGVAVVMFIFTYIYYLADEGTRNSSEVHQSWYEYVTYSGAYRPDLSVIYEPAMSLFMLCMFTCHFGMPSTFILISTFVIVYILLGQRSKFKDKLVWKNHYEVRDECPESEFKASLF